MVESEGVPDTEIGRILVNDRSVDLEFCLRDTYRIDIHLVSEAVDIRSVFHFGRALVHDVRFIADVNLGKLSRNLSLLGLDCQYSNVYNDAELAEITSMEERILVTRDRGLLKRADVAHCIFIHSTQPAEQAREVVKRIDGRESVEPFSRCLSCTGLLEIVEKPSIRNLVPADMYANIHKYSRCQVCSKIYWKGAHWEKLKSIVRDITGKSYFT